MMILGIHDIRGSRDEVILGSPKPWIPGYQGSQESGVPKGVTQNGTPKPGIQGSGDLGSRNEGSKRGHQKGLSILETHY